MKKLIINKCMELLTTYNKDLSQRDIDKIKYGLEGLYLTITKLIFIIIVSIILGIWKETLYLMVLDLQRLECMQREVLIALYHRHYSLYYFQYYVLNLLYH